MSIYPVEHIVNLAGAEACCSSSNLGRQYVHLKALGLPLAFLFFMHLQH